MRKRKQQRQRQQGTWCSECSGLASLVRTYPSTALWPLLVLALVLGLGVWGVSRVRHAEVSAAKTRASALATNAASWFLQSLDGAAAPVPLLAAMVAYNPHFSEAVSMFKGLSPALKSQSPAGSIRRLVLAPSGVVRGVFPPTQENAAALGLDYLNATVTGVPQELTGSVNAVAGHVVAMNGPYRVLSSGELGLRVVAPVFVQAPRWPPVNASVDWSTVNASTLVNGDPLGLPDLVNPGCGWPCEFNETSGERFWGLVGAVIDYTALLEGPDSPLRQLGGQGYHYRLIAPKAPEDMRVVAATSGALDDPVRAAIRLPHNEWVLYIAPADGWSKDWYAGLYAAVVVLAVAMAVLVFAVLVSRRKHQMLLEALLPKELLHDLTSAENVTVLGGAKILRTGTKGAGVGGAKILRTGTTGAGAGGAKILRTDTPADTLMAMMAALLEGRTPDLRDVVFIRTTVLRGLDIYQPLNLRGQIKDANFDADVMQALMRQLGASRSGDGHEGSNHTYGGEGEDGSGGGNRREGDVGRVSWAANGGGRGGGFGPSRKSLGCRAAANGGGGGGGGAEAPSWDTLSGALALILAPSLPAPCGGGGGGGGTVSGEGGLAPLASTASSGSHGLTNGGGGGSSGAVAFASASMTRVDAAAASAPFPTVTAAAAAVAAAAAAGGRGQSSGAGARVIPACLAVTLSRAQSANLAAQHHHSSRSRASASEAAAAAAGVAAPPAPLSSSFAGDGPIEEGGPCNGGGGAAVSGGGAGYRQRLAAAAAAALGRQVSLVSGTASSPVSPLGGRHRTEGAGGLPSAAGTAAGELSGSVRAAAEVAAAPPSPLPLPSALPVVAVPPPVIEEVERVLARVDAWQFDTWQLAEVTQGHALSALGFYLMQREGLIAALGLEPLVLARLLRRVEAGYRANPYHNAVHAADVLQTLHVLVHGAGMHVHYLDRLGLLAAYFAAIVHDHAHPGLTNDFLIATGDPLAVRYNDRSPLENHHAASAFELLLDPDLDAFAPLEPAERAALRKQVIDMVLATDMKQHFSILAHFNTVHRLAAYSKDAGAGRRPGSGEDAREGASGGGAALGSGPGAAPGVGVGGGRTGSVTGPGAVGGLVRVGDLAAAPRPADEVERHLSLQLALKVADIGHLGEDLDVHCRWLGVLEEEFFLQGDRERARGLPISPLFDRAKQGVSKSQVGFYDFVAMPLVHALASAFPGAQPLMACFSTNYNHWRAVDAKTSSTARGSSDAPSSLGTPPTAALPLPPAGGAPVVPTPTTSGAGAQAQGSVTLTVGPDGPKEGPRESKGLTARFVLDPARTLSGKAEAALKLRSSNGAESKG
ncbi:hypothetical protein HYH03_015687 [Edaphochlamys debaryana]|uniref:Phosphodiesterase n=1 Tax=Edaphochlamys debaryana TaxID=47281 RepID=A0A835XLE2_9CHLO|nr:hypothetical protein HYH03_015687 [Edaphochlamys debaryana]|eukprot:KAG2485624.1 hypothetical protein HYH03_015687 [Edaphochlamys debaryana]